MTINQIFFKKKREMDGLPLKILEHNFFHTYTPLLLMKPGWT